MSKKTEHITAAPEAAVPKPSPASPTPAPVQDLEDAGAAYARVSAEALALSEDQFTAMNVDVTVGTSIILGVAVRIVAYRERMAKLPEFDIKHVDNLVDYAKAAWYQAITSLPEPEPKDFQAMLEEGTKLRAHLATWAAPLVHAGIFDQTVIDTIKEGSGNKDIASDVVSYVVLYRSKWNEVKSVCGVTEAELDRGAVLGPALFSAVSRRENKTTPSATDGSLKTRRFWTLADRAYDQCQRGIAFLEWGMADISAIVPSLRKTSGTRSSSSSTTTPTAPTPPVTPVPPVAPVVTAGPQLGGNGGPFTK
jgi:hypothetical protein